MLDKSGKLLEKLLKLQLTSAIENSGGLDYCLLDNMFFDPVGLQLTA